MEFEKEVKELQRQLDAQRQWLTVISSHVEELQPLKKLSKYVSDCDKARFDANEHINDRLTKLEKKFQDTWMNNLPSKILGIAERLQVLECANKPLLMTTNPNICLHCQKDVNELAADATKRLMDEFIEYTKGKVGDL